MKEKKKQPWVRKRHKVITALLRPLIGTYTKWKYGVKVEPFREENGRQYLVMMNHQTAFDQFFVSMAFRQPIYYIASEHLFSLGWLSRLLEWAVAPIPIKKQTTDLKATRTCMQVAKEGGTIALAPEGNRTYSGRTCYFNPAIVKMVKMLKLPVAIFRIEGGYGIQPRWSDVVRKGRMRAYVKCVIEPEEVKAMSNEELHALLSRELWVDEANTDHEYHSPHLAEYLERAMYVCPHCGLSEFESHGDVIACKRCEMQIRYRSDTALEGVNCDFPFPHVAQWYDYQCDFVRKLDLTAHTQAPLYCDTVKMWEVIPYQHKVLAAESAALRLYGDRMEVGSETAPLFVFPFADTDMVTVLGKNKLNVYFGDKLYQISGSQRFNALRHVNIFHHYLNCKEGAEHGEFLGL
ncbi:MAG: 1-acyl-sn-glycerol-3-phosphate acyltransferase [Oscillospiraceae bacterium]|nr:1-acyl-sn-glycerol-3-phosphate acyltransferase [Oscillospiraceae bacterium]